MTKLLIHQIYYSDQTRAMLDPGFAALDNSTNARPDWREYWPIRRHLMAGSPDKDALVGYFSPRFGRKTGLDSAAVRTFVERAAADAEVVLFSPFFDQIAAYWNIFENGISHHPGSQETFRAAVARIMPGVTLEALTMDSRNTVFCNFFLAKPRFWREWLRLNEMLYAIAESGQGALAAGLNAPARYAGGDVPVKVFMMERIASLMLATDPAWKVVVHDPLRCPLDALFAPFRRELVCLDALKIAATVRPSAEYRAVYRDIRRQIADRSKADFEVRRKQEPEAGTSSD